MTTPQVLSWHQLNEAIAAKRDELRQLEAQAAFMRDKAIATARNFLRAYEISPEELNSSLADDWSAQTARRSVRRVATPRPAGPAPDNSMLDAGPLSRLSSTVKTVLAKRGLKTFEAIARAADSGEIRSLLGPTRLAQFDAWLKQELAQSRST